jgi:site-specific DNA-methyltransferase (adenine-specific)
MEQILNENAITVLDRMISKDYKVDLIATDPPYKVTTRGGYTNAGGMMLDKKMRNGSVFNENTLTIKEWLPKLYKVLKDTGHCYIMCNNKNLYPFLDAVKDSEFHLVKTMIWAKDNKIMSQAYMSQIEFILFLRKGKFIKINNCGTSDLLQYPNAKTKNIEGKPIHPTEKPIELMKTLIENSSKENEVVFDPFLGVGTTALASKQLNRGYIGVELDENYYKLAKKRVEKKEEKEFTPPTLFN